MNCFLLSALFNMYVYSFPLMYLIVFFGNYIFLSVFCFLSCFLSFFLSLFRLSCFLDVFPSLFLLILIDNATIVYVSILDFCLSFLICVIVSFLGYPFVDVFLYVFRHCCASLFLCVFLSFLVFVNFCVSQTLSLSLSLSFLSQLHGPCA